MSVEAAEGAGAVWMDLAPADRQYPPARLRHAVEDAFAQVPHIQRRHRQALAATMGGAGEGFALAEAWFTFHRRLFELRCSPTMAAMSGDEPLDDEATDAALAAAAGLFEAHTDLVRAIRYAPRFAPQGREAASVQLACWRLLRGHDGYLRCAVARALTLAVGSDGPHAVQLAMLVADHLAADQALSEHWSLGAPAAEATSGLADWAWYDQRLRDLIELTVLGPLAAFELPATPPALPPDQHALDGVRAAVTAMSRESHAIVARCRAMLAALHGQDRATRRARDGLLRLWGRYDDMLTDLHALLVHTRGGRVAARLPHAELVVAAQLRDELVAALAEQEALQGFGVPREWRWLPDSR
jgi:hypothetical protein